MNAGGGDSPRGLLRVQNSGGLVATIRLILGLSQRRNFLRLRHLPTRALVENTLGNTPRLRTRKRLDVDHLAGEQLVQMSPGYFFTRRESETIINASKLLLNQSGVIGRSSGARHLSLKNSTHTAGWDIVEHSGRATFLQLDSGNEQLIESYALNQKLIGWNRTHVVYRDQEKWDFTYPDEGIVLFGSYMDQWGHFVIDIAFRLIDNIDPRKKTNIFVQQGTPENAKEIIRMFAPQAEIWEVPVGKSITLQQSIVPLSRTLCPVGWNPDIHAHENGWGWSIDGPAVRKLPKLGLLEKDERKTRRRVFLDRAQENVALSNGDEVKSFLKKQGFEFIQAEKQSLKELGDLLNDCSVVVAGNGSQLLNLLFWEKPLSVIRFASRLDGALGVGSGLTYAGHNCITIVCDWARIPQGSKYEMKQAPLSVNLESLEDALEKADALARVAPSAPPQFRAH